MPGTGTPFWPDGTLVARRFGSAVRFVAAREAAGPWWGRALLIVGDRQAIRSNQTLDAVYGAEGSAERPRLALA